MLLKTLNLMLFYIFLKRKYIKESYRVKRKKRKKREKNDKRKRRERKKREKKEVNFSFTT